MKHIQEYEKLFLDLKKDLKKSLTSALANFIESVYKETPGLRVRLDFDNGFEVSQIDVNRKQLWADLTIRDYVDGDRIGEKYEIEFITYGGKMSDMLSFFKDKITYDQKINFNQDFFGCVPVKDVKRFIKEELTLENFELFINSKKYNL